MVKRKLKPRKITIKRNSPNINQKKTTLPSKKKRYLTRKKTNIA